MGKQKSKSVAAKKDLTLAAKSSKKKKRPPPPSSKKKAKPKRKTTNRIATLSKTSGKKAPKYPVNPPQKGGKAEKKKAKAKKATPEVSTTEAKKAKQINLPVNRGTVGPFPWMTNKVVGSDVVDLTQDESDNSVIDLTGLPSKKVRLPTDDLDQRLMERLSEELRAFADYVRLTEVECVARKSLREQIHQVAIRVFQNSPEVDVSRLALEPFGSFACKSVCTFISDVDVALWGAVGPMVKAKNRVVNINTERSEVSAPNTKKKLKQKWLLALMDEQNLMSPDHVSNEEGDASRATSDSLSDRKPSVTNDTSADDSRKDHRPLFVLDRTGVVDESTEKEKTNGDMPDQGRLASVSVSTQATITESEASVEGTAPTNKKMDDMLDHNLNSVDSDDDTADKLTENVVRTSSLVLGETNALHSLRNCDSESEEEEDTKAPAVNFFHQSEPEEDVNASKFSRRKVIDGLQRFFRGLRNSDLSSKIQLISRARVPIIKMEANLGVEFDCSIGGMNGADTSLYAQEISRKYCSFGPVVVALKIIMNQQELDTPFSGGLGSYKLYVLVGSHIAKHLELGGRDDPAEIFLSFAYRYGASVGHKHAHQKTRTSIDQHDIVSCEEGGTADLSNVFLIKECRILFGQIWKRLSPSFRKTGNSSKAPASCQSFLASVIHVTCLDERRRRSIANAETFVRRHRSNGQELLRNKGSAKAASPAVPRGRKKRGLPDDGLGAGYAGRPAKRRK